MPELAVQPPVPARPLDGDTLRREFACLAAAVAHPSRHDVLYALYAAAHQRLPSLQDESAEERAQIDRILEHGIDPWAIEPWLRSGDRAHLLTRKLALIQALLDAHPDAAREAPAPSLVRDALHLCRELTSLLIARLKAKLHGLL